MTRTRTTALTGTLFLFAANGIGTIRGMQGDPRHLLYRERVAKGELFSPRIYAAGPGFTGNSASTAETAVQMVVAQKAAGYDLLKILTGVPRAAFDALAAKADEVGIRFAGHVPADVGLQRALEAKYHSIDHLDGYIEALEEYLVEVRRGCTKIGVDYQLVQTNDYIDAVLSKFLHYRMALRTSRRNTGAHMGA